MRGLGNGTRQYGLLKSNYTQFCSIKEKVLRAMQM